MRLKIIVPFVLLVILTGCSKSFLDDTLREISEGSIIGLEGANNTYVWKGIPFAKPPTGELRWKAPQDPSSWTETLETGKDQPDLEKKVKMSGVEVKIVYI